ncbi:hypothetical protein VOLCADRAFT_97235 [Volvox carteri f. nagariensis]|uniref:Protein kinase domain-containing protein n=1 Tax=Volvox carteri f. nagariensis TaxID=3068 RepID=D8UC79_VOLCA|nr:uncharacterized protein VOLCADRAFT_97235 [Volvox carteri f. nagariensis]EFJ42601.1 hypothetical protein VOLCADRAFT_97235 [Volvox carteri f. nagariensis]|eukprot:XP_002956252.1 hypothetical protein VOLCADRAFT_97235 [Volvox carteri f. nagariensis]
MTSTYYLLSLDDYLLSLDDEYLLLLRLLWPDGEWRLYIIQEYADGGPLRKLYGNKALWPSPGVVNLEWRLYIIQEYADGGPLRKLYGNKALWPSPGVVNLCTPAVVGLALGIARALSHLHSKRIIHGDLNPNNVLLNRDVNEPSGYIVKVGDFGLSVMLPQNRTHLSNLRMGTMFYMCPALVMKGGGGAADGGGEDDPSGRGCSSGVDSSGVGDMQAELGRMAQELRASVRDVAIRLEAVIGSGSFGTVYKGTWQGLSVAVKTLVFSASDDNRRRSLQEAALCASISHPNVVATYSSELQPLGALGTVTGPNSATSGEREKVPDGGMPPPPPPRERERERERDLSQILEWRLYIIQEYADGGPLRKLYGNKALWPSPGVVNLDSLGHHRWSAKVGMGGEKDEEESEKVLGTVVRRRTLNNIGGPPPAFSRLLPTDLNPNNVLLKRDVNEPSGYIVKVGDFGLSVMLPQNRTHLSNLRMGTMFYMCPAVVMKGQVGPPSDELGSLATGAAGDSFTGSSMLPSTQGHGAGASSA